MVSLNRDLSDLLAWLDDAPAPYRAWAADALAAQRGRRGRAEGKSLVEGLLGDAEAGSDDYGVLAARFLLRRRYSKYAKFKNAGESLPPLPKPGKRGSTFYESPLLAYLVARGISEEAGFQQQLALLVGHALETASLEKAPLFVQLLWLGALCELNDPTEIAPGARRLIGQLDASAAAAGERTAALWTIEIYGPTLEKTREGRVLKGALEDMVVGHEITLSSGADLTLRLMSFECALRERGTYEVVRSDMVDSEVLERLGIRATMGGLSAGILGLLATAIPLVLASNSSGTALPPTQFLVAWLAFGVPVAGSIALSFLKGRRVVFGWTLLVGGGYYALVILAERIPSEEVASALTKLEAYAVLAGLLLTAVIGDQTRLRSSDS